LAGASAVAVARTDSTLRAVSRPNSLPWWYLFFFVSGFPALLYQIVWQRALFTLYGVNIESVTMVVTAFMLGLGLGSLVGGIISRRHKWPLLGVFGLVELLIGAYGICSLKIFHWAADFTAGSSPLQTGLIAFALVVLPTVLMGATLPILVSYTVHLSRNVGTSVGALYAANTLGSATACFAAGLSLMRWLGQSKTVALAAGLNVFVGVTVLLLQFARARAVDGRSTDEKTTQPAQASTKLSPVIRFPSAVVIGAAAGFIALGYEIVWYRLFSFTTGGLAKSFAYLLGAYLAGIAAGSLVTNRLCKTITNPQAFLRFLTAAILSANLLAFIVGPVLFYLVTRVSYLWTLVPIGLAAACLGGVFPMLCHISISPDEGAGARMSYLYLSNIFGSALGSYVTGFVLMDVLPLRSVCVVLSLLGLGLGGVLLPSARLSRGRFLFSAGGFLVAALFVVEGVDPLFHHMYEKMQIKHAYVPAAEFQSIVENRNGIITVSPDGQVFGGGIYDGRFNTSLVDDANGIERPFALSYFHPNPREVLMIGLSSGSWAQVIANHPQVEHLTIVEINPGYLRLIAHNDEVSSLLKNPKVRIEIDDGRRWLVRNATRKFDAVVLNMTYHWRSNASNLLSVEFLELIRKHLSPGGVHFYNTTSSDEVMATGIRVFPYGMRLGNFMVVSDSPLQLDAQHWLDALVRYRINGKPVFDMSQEKDRRRLDEVLSMTATLDRNLPTFFTLESADHIRTRTQQARLVTDDNMGTEWSQQGLE
jgi:spermidine synthase